MTGIDLTDPALLLKLFSNHVFDYFGCIFKMILDKEREKKEVPWVLLKCVIYSRHMSYAGMWFNGSSRGVYVGAPLSCTETEWS